MKTYLGHLKKVTKDSITLTRILKTGNIDMITLNCPANILVRLKNYNKGDLLGVTYDKHFNIKNISYAWNIGR